MKWIGDSDMKKKSLDTIYIVFSSKLLPMTKANDLQLHLQRINAVQKKMTMC